MPRPHNIERRVQKKFYLSESLNNTLMTLLRDPGRDRVIYGSLSDYLERLVLEDLRKRGFVESPGNPLDLFKKETGKND